MSFPRQICLVSALLLLSSSLLTPSARANVYATDIKLNGSMDDVTNAPVTISYILNEPASLGVAVKIMSGSTPIKTITLTNGPGTLRGTNTVVWDGKNDSANPVGAGTYSVSITAASSGYVDWKQISSDTNDGNYVWEGRGIAVDRNPASPYYGRVFVGNADTGPGSRNGDIIGIQKLNADGSPADEGSFTTGGFNWTGGFVSPWKIEVSADDFVYIEDFSGNGELYGWDPTLSTNSLLDVLREDNWGNSSNVSLTGPFVFGSGAATQIWMADNNSPAGLGVLSYNLSTNGTCASNYTGVTVVGIGGDTNLNSAPYDVALDQNGTIYTIQSLATPDDPSQRVFRFPAYNPGTNGPPELIADWAIGGGDNEYAQASGVAVDPSGTYVAVAFKGLQIANVLTNGNTKIFYATNGEVVVSLDLADGIKHVDTDCAWDAVGNVYFIDAWASVWRTFSPPGTNQATTAAVPQVQVTGTTQPVQITRIGVTNGTVTLDFTGPSSALPSSFTVLSGKVVTGITNPVPASITTTGAGAFGATFGTNGPVEFYRIINQSGSGPQTPLITGITVSAGTVTVNFTGGTSDTPSLFTLLSGTVVSGITNNSGATITQVGSTGSGLFSATVAASGPRQFYRIHR